MGGGASKSEPQQDVRAPQLQPDRSPNPIGSDRPNLSPGPAKSETPKSSSGGIKVIRQKRVATKKSSKKQPPQGDDTDAMHQHILRQTEEFGSDDDLNTDAALQHVLNATNDMDGQWECTVCTLRNPESWLQCNACGSQRPKVIKSAKKKTPKNSEKEAQRRERAEAAARYQQEQTLKQQQQFFQEAHQSDFGVQEEDYSGYTGGAVGGFEPAPITYTNLTKASRMPQSTSPKVHLEQEPEQPKVEVPVHPMMKMFDAEAFRRANAPGAGKAQVKSPGLSFASAAADSQELESDAYWKKLQHQPDDPPENGLAGSSAAASSSVGSFGNSDTTPGSGGFALDRNEIGAGFDDHDLNLIDNILGGDEEDLVL